MGRRSRRKKSQHVQKAIIMAFSGCP